MEKGIVQKDDFGTFWREMALIRRDGYAKAKRRLLYMAKKAIRKK
jgi:hypothetical protein